MKEFIDNQSVEKRMDELFKSSSVSVGSDFTKRTLSSLAESGEDLVFDRLLEEQWERFPVRASTDFEASVRQKLEQDSGTKASRFVWRRWSLPLSAAAAIALLLVVNPFSLKNHNTEIAQVQMELDKSALANEKDVLELYELALGLKGGQILVDDGAYQTLATLIN